MLPNTTSPMMAMGSAAQLPLSAADLMPASLGAPTGPPPAQAAGMMAAGAGGTPLGGFPSQDAPSEPPFVVELQADGSSIYKTKTTPAVVIGVNKAPKLPPALQPPQKPTQ